MTPAFRASRFLRHEMKTLRYIEKAVEDLRDKHDNFIKTIERMVDELDDDEVKMLVE